MFPRKITFVLLAAALALLESCSRICLTGTPDLAAFGNVVLSPALRDSLSHNTLTLGMPYSAVRSVFGGCGCDTSIAVASRGSRQPLDESEGLYSHFHDDNIKMYLNKYKTSQGDLYIWYGRMDFYRAQVMADDSVALYSASGVAPAHVTELLAPNKFHVDSTLTKSAIPYAEIYPIENLSGVSYWYDLKISDAHTVKLNTQSTPTYPILHMELGTTPIKSFHWK